LINIASLNRLLGKRPQKNDQLFWLEKKR